jgi:hypothetical protein
MNKQEITKDCLEKCETCFFYHLCKGFKLPYCKGEDYIKQKGVDEK